ncbi:MAG: GNAT family N-acetyltransferase [Clostridia bacterium]|nr:GNAT family N-acetyltransferase [Clostridia bacterium]
MEVTYLDRRTLLTYFKDPPTLTTERLKLRKILKTDSEDYFEFASDPAVTKYLLWKPHDSFNFTRHYLSYLQGRYRAGEFYDWGIVDLASGKFIGTCGFTSFDLTNNSAEVGYVLSRGWWHRGIAAEALTRVLDFGFNTLGLRRIEARYMADNESSRRVMEKVGMVFEGIRRDALLLDGVYISVGTCAILNDEFKYRS